MRALRLTVTLLLLFLFVPGVARADIVWLTNGTKRSGQIVEETSAYIKLKMKYGVVTIRRSEILKIERVKTKAEIHEEKFEKCETAEDFYKLGLKAREWNLEQAAILDFQKVLELEPDHEGARRALGFRKSATGEWITEEEYYEAKGYVNVDGKWVTPEEAEKIIEARRDKLRAEQDKRQEKFRKQLQGVPWAQAHTIETDHYIIRCNSTKEVAQQYADFMEALYDAYSKVFGKYKKHWHKKSTIYILRSHEEFMDMLNMGPNIGGFYRPGKYLGLPPRIVSAFHGPFGETSDTFDVLAHEATHQFEHLIMDGAQKGQRAVRDFMVRPDWIIEGLAVYFGDGHKVEKSGRRQTIKVGIPRDRLLPLQRWMRSGKYLKQLPLKTLIRIPHRMFSGAFYAPAWGLCYWMLQKGEVTVDGKKVDLRGVFEKFLEKLTEPPPAAANNPNYYAQMFEQMLGVPLKKLDKPFMDYILSLKVDAIGVVKGRKYVSKEMGVQARRPSRYWEWDTTEGLRPGEIVVLNHKRSSGRISITARGNGMLMTAPDVAERMHGNFGTWLEDMDMTRDEEYFHRGFDGYIFEFEGNEKATKTADINPRNKRQRYRRLIFTNLKNIYYVTMQADADEFEDLEDDFEEFLEDFDILAIE